MEREDYLDRPQNETEHRENSGKTSFAGICNPAQDAAALLNFEPPKQEVWMHTPTFPQAFADSKPSQTFPWSQSNSMRRQEPYRLFQRSLSWLFVQILFHGKDRGPLPECDVWFRLIFLVMLSFFFERAG